MKIQSERAYAVIKNNKISPTDIYNYEVTTHEGEYIIPVLITPLRQKPEHQVKSLKCYCGDYIRGRRLKYCSDYCERHKEQIRTIV